MDNTIDFKNPDERKAFKVGDPELFSIGGPTFLSKKISSGNCKNLQFY